MSTRLTLKVHKVKLIRDKYRGRDQIRIEATKGRSKKKQKQYRFFMEVPYPEGFDTVNELGLEVTEHENF